MNDVDIRANIATYFDPVEMPGGYLFDTAGTLRKAELYYNSQFESGEEDEMGNHKYFLNIVKPACDLASKMVDLDTKDIILHTEKSGEEHLLWLMQRDLSQWLKENKFSQLLNQIVDHYPKYGHVVVKHMKTGEWKLVNITNVRFNPGAQCQDEDTFFYEVHFMTKREIMKMPWDEDAKEDLFNRSNDHVFAVYECYDLSEDGMKWNRSIRADLLRRKTKSGTITTPESEINEHDEYLPSVILHEDEVDETPYRELKWEDVPGRRLGRGYVEYLFENQQKVNEIEHYEGRSLALNSLTIFQTQDEQVARNLLEDKYPGDVIVSPSGLQPVATENRNLQHFATAKQKWEDNARQKTFSFDVVKGETMPSGTTLGATQIAAGMVVSFFDLKRENLGLFIKYIVLDDILPAFKRDTRKEHILKFLGNDREIQKVYQAVVASTVREQLFKHATKTGLFPGPEEITRAKEKAFNMLKKKKDVFFKISKGLYDNVKLKVDVLVTGEAMNMGARAQTMQIALQMLASNPAILESKVTRTLFFKMLTLGGVSPNDINLLEDEVEADIQEARDQQQQMMQQQQQGRGAFPRENMVQEQAQPGTERIPENVR